MHLGSENPGMLPSKSTRPRRKSKFKIPFLLITTTYFPAGTRGINYSVTCHIFSGSSSGGEALEFEVREEVDGMPIEYFGLPSIRPGTVYRVVMRGFRDPIGSAES